MTYRSPFTVNKTRFLPIPSAKVCLQMWGISRHSSLDAGLNLLGLLISFNYHINRLQQSTWHIKVMKSLTDNCICWPIYFKPQSFAKILLAVETVSKCSLLVSTLWNSLNAKLLKESMKLNWDILQGFLTRAGNSVGYQLSTWLCTASFTSRILAHILLSKELKHQSF